MDTSPGNRLIHNRCENPVFEIDDDGSFCSACIDIVNFLLRGEFSQYYILVVQRKD